MKGDAHGAKTPCICYPCRETAALLEPAAALAIVDGYCTRLAKQNPDAAPSAELAAGLGRREALRRLVGA